MSAFRGLYSASWFKVYTSFVSDIDLTADGPSSGSETRYCRRITVLGAGTGTLVVKRGDGTSITITGLAAGQSLDIQSPTIVSSGTTVTSVLVQW